MTHPITLPRARLALALALGLGAALAPIGAQAAGATPFGVNLVKNPGAEDGPGTNGYTTVDTPHWKVTPSFTVVRYGAAGFPTKAESARIGGDRKFFACGNQVEYGTAKQRMKLNGRNTVIDNGHVQVKLSLRIASYDSQEDSGAGFLSFLDGAGQEIDTINTPAVEATDDLFIKKTIKAILPAGTRTLRVELIGIRDNDNGPLSYCDAYFDNVDLTLKLV